jgi:transcription initiation factor IIE alpha subunit
MLPDSVDYPFGILVHIFALLGLFLKVITMLEDKGEMTNNDLQNTTKNKIKQK